MENYSIWSMDVIEIMVLFVNQLFTNISMRFIRNSMAQFIFCSIHSIVFSLFKTCCWQFICRRIFHMGMFEIILKTDKYISFKVKLASICCYVESIKEKNFISILLRWKKISNRQINYYYHLEKRIHSSEIDFSSIFFVSSIKSQFVDESHIHTYK